MGLSMELFMQLSMGLSRGYMGLPMGSYGGYGV